MATLYFDPVQVSRFTEEMSSLFSSLKSNFDTIGTNMNSIANGKWKGSAALKNLQSLDEAQVSLARFINSFGNALTEAMKEAKTKVSKLETTNLGENLNFTISENEKINVAELNNVDTSVVEYDYAEISSIAGSIKTVYNSICGCKDNIPNKIRSYIGGDVGSAWRGNAADEFLNTVISAFNKISTPIENLKTCVNNIDEAAANAQRADQ